MLGKNKVKLNLGSGNDYRSGWINVDAVENGRVDVVADLSKKFPFKNESVDEILASDILEHFTKEDGEAFLTECWRVLKTNGLITIRTHDIYKIFSKFYLDNWVVNHFIYGDTSSTGIFGSHKYSYNENSIKKLLNILGFEINSIEDEETNILVVAHKIKKPNKNLNIGIIMQSPDFGGAEEYMLSLISQFKKNGHQVSVATNEGKYFNYLKNETKDVYSIPLYLDIIGNLKGFIKTIILLPYAIFFYAKLLRKYKKNGVNVILMSNFSEKLLVSILSAFYSFPVIWIEYGPLETVLRRNFFIPKILYRIISKIPYKIIVPSENTKNDLLKQSRVSLSKVEVIPCGVEIKNNFKKEKHGDKIIIGNVSRQSREKGQEYLLNVIPLIIQNHKNVKFLFVGDGPDLKRYKEIANELKIEEYVEFTGFVKSVDKYYSKMDMFVFSSVWELEGFGLVAVEAMARKIPVIGNNHGPIKETLGGGAGILVSVKDKYKLASEILGLIENKNKRIEIGKKGFSKAVINYDISINTRQYEKLFIESI